MTITSTQEAFLAAIRERPEDDAPRLIYADWLRENGQEYRAEFIAVQIELAKLGPKRRHFEVDIETWTMYKGVALPLVGTKIDEPRVEVGERIDITLKGKPSDTHYLYGQGKLRRKYYGLLVKSANYGSGRHGVENALEVVMDPQSTQWEGETLTSLERKLLGDHWQEWSRCFRQLLGGYDLGFNGHNIGTQFNGNQLWFNFDRGFISRIDCRSDTWWGGPCEYCGGTGEGGPTIKCFHCTEGYMLGLGPKMLGCWDMVIDKVIITDKRPDDAYWWWMDQQGSFSSNRAYLPAAIFNMLGTAILSEDYQGRHGIKYASISDATKALSDAAIRWAKPYINLPNSSQS